MKTLYTDKVSPPEGFESSFIGSSLIQWLDRSIYMRCRAIIGYKSPTGTEYQQKWFILEYLQEHFYEDY